MTSRADIRAHIEALTEATRDNGLVPMPVGWVRALLNLGGVTGDEGGRRPCGPPVGEVAEIFGRHPNTVRDWLQSGQIRGYKLRGKEWRVPRAAIRGFQGDQAESPARPARTGPTVLIPADLSAWARDVINRSDWPLTPSLRLRPRFGLWSP